MDDEAIVARTLRRALKRYDVKIATTADEAQELMQAHDFAVIFCDLNMPDVTGMELYGRLAESRPGLEDRMVFMTGGAYTPEAQAFLQAVSNPAVQKPFDLAALRALVAERVGF